MSAEVSEVMRLRVVKVDRYGFNGRDYHPRPEDVGLVVTVAKSEVWFATMDGRVEPLFSGDGGPSVERPVCQDAMPLVRGEASEDAQLFTMYTCVRDDGTAVELVEHEVEVEGSVGLHARRQAADHLERAIKILGPDPGRFDEALDDVLEHLRAAAVALAPVELDPAGNEGSSWDARRPR